MMLTEHVELLRELESSQNKVKRPVLDMSQIEDMEIVISEAMEFNNPVQLFQLLPFLNSFHKSVSVAWIQNLNDCAYRRFSTCLKIHGLVHRVDARLFFCTIRSQIRIGVIKK
ncbi:YolD-like family protein [Bacillus paralicheniformis]|uniref:YolD-like family protein n=1 Tax=Bacillus paralicheniformis TaxID=1648923 RepID=UPI0013EF43AF|nr:YolD-like family protein [Bacillus paralicheniformis]QII50365.1 YolD-like family protein [Bacillus paralicheniformis]